MNNRLRIRTTSGNNKMLVADNELIELKVYEITLAKDSDFILIDDEFIQRRHIESFEELD